MTIIRYPWIAIHIDTDCIRVAYPVSKNAESVEPLIVPEHYFDMVFHYSPSENRWRFGADAWECLEKAPEGFVTIPSNPLQWDRPLSVVGDITIRPSELIVQLLRYIKDYCATALFEGTPVCDCVISFQHRYNTIRTVFRRLAAEAGFEHVLVRDAMVAGALLWKSQWQLDRNFILLCHIGDSQVTTTLLVQNFQGYAKTVIRSHTISFGTEKMGGHLLSQLCGGNVSWSHLSGREQLLLRKYCLDRLRGISPEQSAIIIDGVSKVIEPSHWKEALANFLSTLREELTPYLKSVLKKIPSTSKEVSFVVLGMGHHDVDLEHLLQDYFGHNVEWCYFWPQSEYAIPMGLAVMLQPPKCPMPRNDADDQTKNLYYPAKTHYERYLKATSSGDFRAQYKLGRNLEDGQIVCRCEEEAVDWFRLSARQGYPKAKYRLAYMIARDQGTDFDRQELGELISDLERKGFQMEAFWQGVSCFQKARKIEIENQKLKDSSKNEEVLQLKNEAETHFKTCRTQNRSFPSSHVPKGKPHPPLPTVNLPFPITLPPELPQGLSPELPQGLPPELPTTDLLLPDNSSSSRRSDQVDSILGYFTVAVVLLIGGFFLLQDAVANSIARHGASICFIAGLISLLTALTLLFRFFLCSKKQELRCTVNDQLCLGTS